VPPSIKDRSSHRGNYVIRDALHFGFPRLEF
jgi:hypothetical protein